MTRIPIFGATAPMAFRPRLLGHVAHLALKLQASAKESIRRNPSGCVLPRRFYGTDLDLLRQVL